jgi:hypothetical protein
MGASCRVRRDRTDRRNNPRPQACESDWKVICSWPAGALREIDSASFTSAPRGRCAGLNPARWAGVTPRPQPPLEAGPCPSRGGV